MKNGIMVTLFYTLILSTAMAKDVSGPKGITHGSSYVRVTQPAAGRVSFESCISGYEKSSCTFLGRNKSYSIDKLQTQKYTENLQIVGSVAADAVVVAGSILTGGAVGAAIFGAGTAVGTMAFLVGAAGGATASGAAVIMVDALNPSEQYKQARTISNDVVNDQQVEVDDINDFIKRLDLVLSKI